MFTDDGTSDQHTLADLFERAAAAYPLRPALCSRDSQFNYEQLNVIANRLAHALIERGGAPGDRIAISMLHDLPLIVVLLAVLKAGRIVVVLNPTHPAARLRQLVDDAEPSLILTDHANERLTFDLAGDNHKIVRYEDLVVHPATHNPSAGRAGQAAALGYTSGSTGRPKAVIQTHRQFARNVSIHTEAMRYSPDDRLPLFGSVSGGQGFTMVFCTLLNGAALCPFPVTIMGITGLAEWMADLGITVYSSSASIFRNFMKTIDGDFRFVGVRAVRLSSEPATSDDFKMFQQHFESNCVFVHTLSSSETCNIAWSRRSIGETVPEGRLPIGLPSRGQEVLLLDASGLPVDSGQIGEIAIKSRYVAAGYWRNEALTSEKFSADLDGRGTRLVRTGDLGRINADGLLEFIGRSDDQVKIRGNRIELSEIEGALHGFAGVRRAVVETIGRLGDEPILVGFVMQDHGQAWSPTALRSALRKKLPDHMVPSRFFLIDELPITPTGKVDREALRKTDLSLGVQDAAEAPQTEMELFLADMWREAFNLGQVHRNDNFFDLGGDSLIAAVMSSRLHETFGLEIELATFFDFPGLAELAEEIDGLRRIGTQDAAVQRRAARPAKLPLTYNQESFWDLSKSRPASLTMSRCSRITGPLDVAMLTRCIDAIVRRHEMLRTTFEKTDGRLNQIVHPPAEASLQLHDVSAYPDAEARARQVRMSEQARIFDLTVPPLACFALIRLSKEEHWLVYTAHGILLDGLSWNIFFWELAQLYEAQTQGRASSLLEDTPQYGDYAVWQWDVLHPDGQRYRKLLAWWIEDVLTASYPDNPMYCKAVLWCMNVIRPKQQLLKRAIGVILRTACMAPLPPRAELPFKRKGPVGAIDPGQGMIEWGLPPDVSSRLSQLGRQEGTSDHVTRVAAYVAMLAAETRDPNVVLYTSLSNRGRSMTRGVFGCCATPAILMFRCDGHSTFRELLGVVRDRLRKMQLHADLPYDRVHREMRAWKIKMPQGRAILSQAWTHARMQCGDLEIACLPDRFLAAAPLVFDVKFDMAREDSNCTVLFDAEHYDPEQVRGFIDRFVGLLGIVSRTPDIQLGDAMASIKNQ